MDETAPFICYQFYLRSFKQTAPSIAHPPKNDIIAGIHASMVSRIVGFAKRIGIKPDVILTGGVAKNVGFAKILEEALKTKLSIPDEPRMVAALGAARFMTKPFSVDELIEEIDTVLWEGSRSRPGDAG